MKVLFVWDSDYPWDIRVEKICNTLTENGWEVHLVCRNKLRRPLNETYEGISIHRLSFLPEKYGSWNDVFGFPAFFSPIWLRKIRDVAKRYCVDLIIVRDLPMALAAIMVGKIEKTPVIFDMAECYPEMIRLIWKYEPFRIQNLVVRNPFFVDILEKLVLSLVDHIFVMVEESKDRLLAKKIPDQKISIVSNTPVWERFEHGNPSFPGRMKEHQRKMILLYVGFLNFSRGLDTVLDSLAEYRRIDTEFFLVLLGNGTAEQFLKMKTQELFLNEWVTFEGWVDNRKIPEYIASSDVCLVPHHKCGHWNHTIPNKLFDYMAAGKPVLVSDVIPMKRIVESERCGVVYRDGNIKSFIEGLKTLQNSQLSKELGINGSLAVQEKYNWGRESVVMLAALERLVSGRIRN